MNSEENVVVEKKKNKLGIIAIVLVVVLFLGALVYFGVDYVNLKKDAKKTEETKLPTTNENEDKDNKEDKITDLKVDDKKVLELYEYIPVWLEKREISYMLANAYQNKKVELKDIDNVLLLGKAYEFLDGKKITGDDGEYSYFKVEDIQEAAKKIYGTNIKNEDFFYDGAFVTLKGDTYEAYDEGDDVWFWSEYLRNITKAYETDEYLYIEDSVLLIYLDGDSSDDFIFDVYNPLDKTKLGQEKYNEEEYNEKAEAQECWAEEDAYENDDCYGSFDLMYNEVLKKYGDNKVTYKHTFKKTQDGSYIWVSSEPIK